MNVQCLYCDGPTGDGVVCRRCRLTEVEAWRCDCRGEWLVYGHLCPDCRSGVCPYDEYVVQPGPYSRPQVRTGWACTRCSRFYSQAPGSRLAGYCQRCDRLAERYGPLMTRRYWEFLRYLRGKGLVVG